MKKSLKKEDSMGLSKFKHVKIKGISTVVPEKEINIYDEAQYYGNNIKKIDRMRKIVGFYKRHVVDEGVTASDLCINAGEILLSEMNIDKDSIDALIFVVQRPDHSSPATAYYIHDKLKLSKNCMAFDIRQGCTGWVYGLYVASALIESGAAKRILLLAGDTPSSGVNPADRNVAPVFGDGGSATLLEYSDEINKSYFNITVQSNGYEAIIKPSSGYRLPFLYDESDKELTEYLTTPAGNKERLVDLHLDGIAVFDFTMNAVPSNIEDLMKHFGFNRENIDYLMLHQANKQIVQTLSSKLGFSDEKAPYYSFEAFGNQSITSIPIAISYNIQEEMQTTEKRILASGFGNGLAVASCIINTDKIYCSGIRMFKKPEDFLDRKQYIKYWKEKITN